MSSEGGDTLFPMPERNETRLEKAKREHHIWTHYSEHMEPDERWIAIKFEDARTAEDPWHKIMSHIGYYEESGLTGVGATEEAAVLECGRKVGLHITL